MALPEPGAEPTLLVPQPGATGLQPRTVPERVAHLCVPRRAGSGRGEAALRLRRDLRLDTRQRKRWRPRRFRAPPLFLIVVVVVYSLRCAGLNGGVKGKHVASRAERNRAAGPACPAASAR